MRVHRLWRDFHCLSKEIWVLAVKPRLNLTICPTRATGPVHTIRGDRIEGTHNALDSYAGFVLI